MSTEQEAGCSTSAAPAIAGLDALLTDCNLPQEVLAAACSWFEEQGLASVAQLKESEREEEFIAALTSTMAALLRERLGQQRGCADGGASAEKSGKRPKGKAAQGASSSSKRARR